MKKIFVKLVALLAITAGIVSCVEDDFDIPEVTVTAPELDGDVITLGAFASLYQQALLQEGQDLGIVDFNGNILDEGDFAELRDDFQFTFQNDSGNVFMSGYVISSDEAGNFFEELILQDAPENPTAGIRFLIDLNPLFTRYEIGRRLFIRLNGLTAGISNGVLTLGIEGNFIEQVPGFDETDRLIRDVEVATIVPRTITFEGLSDDLTNLFVQVDNVQFNRNEVISANLTYAGEATDEFDGERTLESCDSNASVIFSTSTFADFKSLLLPTGRGSVSGVLTRDFFGEVFNLVVNDPSNVALDQEDRCDPVLLDCEDMEVTGPDILFQDFESLSNLGELEADGWVIENVSGGTTVFELDDFAGNQYAIANGFSSDETGIDTWFITPEINLDATAMDGFEVEVQTNFNNGVGLTILISTDFAGDILNATWSEINDATVPMGSTTGFGNFESTGAVNLSCIDGSSVRIAFRYQGSDEAGGTTTRYHVDNIRVNGM